MRSAQKIYEILLAITHFIARFLTVLYDFYGRFQESFSQKFSHEDVERLDNLFRRLNKLPQHLTVILGTEEPSFKDLVNIIVWCTASGIPFLTLYDHNGSLKRRRDEFYETLNALTGFENNKGVWTKTEPPFNGYKNSFTRKIRIDLHDLEDGRRCMIDTAKQLSSSNAPIDNINVDYIDNYLRNVNGKAPDPDVAIYCGRACATYGYMPWQLRTTEFFHLRTHHGVTLENFYDVLTAYGNCQQRYGK